MALRAFLRYFQHVHQGQHWHNVASPFRQQDPQVDLLDRTYHHRGLQLVFLFRFLVPMLAKRILLDAVHWRQGILHGSFHRCRRLLWLLCRDLCRRLDLLNSSRLPSLGFADGKEGEGLRHHDSGCRRTVSDIY